MRPICSAVLALTVVIAPQAAARGPSASAIMRTEMNRTARAIQACEEDMPDEVRSAVELTMTFGATRRAVVALAGDDLPAEVQPCVERALRGARTRSLPPMDKKKTARLAFDLRGPIASELLVPKVEARPASGTPATFGRVAKIVVENSFVGACIVKTMFGAKSRFRRPPGPGTTAADVLARGVTVRLTSDGRLTGPARVSKTYRDMTTFKSPHGKALLRCIEDKLAGRLFTHEVRGKVIPVAPKGTGHDMVVAVDAYQLRSQYDAKGDLASYYAKAMEGQARAREKNRLFAELERIGKIADCGTATSELAAFAASHAKVFAENVVRFNLRERAKERSLAFVRCAQTHPSVADSWMQLGGGAAAMLKKTALKVMAQVDPLVDVAASAGASCEAVGKALVAALQPKLPALNKTAKYILVHCKECLWYAHPAIWKAAPVAQIRRLEQLRTNLHRCHADPLVAEVAGVLNAGLYCFGPRELHPLQKCIYAPPAPDQ